MIDLQDIQLTLFAKELIQHQKEVMYLTGYFLGLLLTSEKSLAII